MDGLVLRSYYRYYWDDFGIQGHTMSLEAPMKLNGAWTASPFYRYHTQIASQYFAPYQIHQSDALFYTSDYDLSDLSSHKFGLGIKYNPLYGLGRMKVPFRKKNVMLLKSMEVRGAYYERSTGLNAFIVSMGLSFTIK